MGEKEELKSQTETTQGEVSVLDDLVDGYSKNKRGEEGFDLVSRGLKEYVRLILRHKDRKVSQAAANEMIAEIDKKLSRQLDAILHHEKFQALESAWRGLKMVVDRTDFRENIKIELLSVSKADLLADFEDSPEIPQSGLYQQVYNRNYGVFGGEPIGAIVSNYQFTAGSQDVALLQNCAAVANMSHAPFIAGVAPEFFGEKKWDKVGRIKDFKTLFEGPKYTKWRGFRESEDARNVGLVMPRTLLRLPYGGDNPVKSFNYEEVVTDDHDHYLWGSAAYAMATRLTDAFAKYRFCSNIVGPKGGGAVEDLPVHTFESSGEIQAKIPTEILLPEATELELSDLGFISLVMRKGSDNAAFFAANSAQKPKVFAKTPQGLADQTNYKLGTRLPYLFLISRFAHYLKVLQREEVGRNSTPVQIEQELNQWIGQYIVDMDSATDEIFARKPLRKAAITVEEVPGEVGWYRVNMKLQPHIKIEGMNIEMSLVGKLDKPA